MEYKTMSNIRQFLNTNDGYSRINREERNHAAIFYHTLLLNDNLKKFLYNIQCVFPIEEQETAIYFEYAYLRDLWNSIKNKEVEMENKIKRQLILDFLKPSNRDELNEMKVHDFNRYFGAARTLSSKFIVSPSNWSLIHFDENISVNEEFLNVCMFKWCFNAKPDIVIHTTHNTAICIEAKYESKEGQYPSDKEEKKIFTRRFGKGLTGKNYLIGQLQIQEKIMELLGIETKFIFLVKKKGHSVNDNTSTLTWKEAFENLDTNNCPYFVKEWIKRLTE